jgi:hypothetical protein
MISTSANGIRVRIVLFCDADNFSGIENFSAAGGKCGEPGNIT